MALAAGASPKTPELDSFLNYLYSRWSREACPSLYAFEPGANGCAARVVFDEELATLRESSRAVKIAFRTLTAYVGSQRNKFCTINNLPSEILREILLSACESGLRSGDL